MEVANILYAFLLLSPLIFLTFNYLRRANRPPGNPLPILGRANVHITMSDLAKTYGPIMSIKLGTQHYTVVSSPDFATEILKTHDRILSGRKVPDAAPFRGSETDNMTLGWSAECNEQWKNLRMLCRTELFSGKVLESQTCLREEKAIELVNAVRGMEGKEVDIGEVIFASVLNTLSNVLLSCDLLGSNGESGLKGLITQIMELSVAPNVSDLCPILRRLDLQGLRKKSIELSTRASGVWKSVINRRREMKGAGGSRKPDFLDVLIEKNFTDHQINQLFLELFSAGTETSTSTIVWAMTELIRNPRIMTKVREELTREIDKDSKESHLSQLTYLQACVKETLRLHPPAPFLLPHRAIETCQVMKYTIPEDSRVIVNVWAIARDPKYWEDPLEFRPERFLKNEIDFRGNDFEYLPFRAGRRICPGTPLVVKQVPLFLASLIHAFDWSMPGAGDPRQIDMSEKYGMTLKKAQPLVLIPKARI